MSTDTSSFIQSLVASVSIGSITVIAVFSFIGRRFFEHILQRNVEYLKVEITQAAQINKDRLTARYNAKFQRLLEAYDAIATFSETLNGFVAVHSARNEVQGRPLEILAERFTKTTQSSQAVRPFITEQLYAEIVIGTQQTSLAMVKYNSDKNLVDFLDCLIKIQVLFSESSKKIADEIRRL